MKMVAAFLISMGKSHNNSTQYAPSGPDAQKPRAAGARRYVFKISISRIAKKAAKLWGFYAQTTKGGFFLVAA